MRRIRFALILAALFVLSAPSIYAQKEQPTKPSFAPSEGWSYFIRGGAVYQFDTDLDEGGSFDARRFTIQGGSRYGWESGKSVSVALGYSYDGYSFSEGGVNGLNKPWEDIHTVSLGVPIRTELKERWSLFFVPSIRAAGEQGASFEDSVSGGILGGFSYRVGDHLTIGPGIGVVSQLEESATVFPILIVNWKITERLSLETGQGLGATLGPGLTLNYQANRNWRLSVGGRYEKLRFRLDDSGTIPGGVGEDQSFPLFASCSYNMNNKTQLSLIGGVELGGNLIVDDDDGNRVGKESYDPGGFLGFAFRVRL